MKHNLIAPLRFIPPKRRTLSAISITLSVVLALAAFGVPVGTSWTYQGQLRRSGAAYNGTCNFQFSLWDAAIGGATSGPQSINGVNVVNGLFTVVLDFGDLSTSQGNWLGTSVQCSGDGGFTQLDPRQSLTATPYALSLRPASSIIDNDSSANRAALFAQSQSTNGIGLWGSAATGIYGVSTADAGNAVKALATGISSSGVFGRSTGQGGSGIYGWADGTDASGVFGRNSTGAGVWGRSTGAGAAVYGQNTGGGFAGRFTGPVLVEGNLIVQGALFKNAGSFRIDHPLDPANKYLSHSFVESPEMKNIYDGNVTTDASGSATVTLPDYFAALNRDYRYQLTVLGQFAQAIVSRKIAANTFEIRTDKPGVEVSWQVTGVRQDAYAKEHPIVVTDFKPAEERGLYLYPAGFGAGEEKLIGYPSRPTNAPRSQEAPAAASSDQSRSK